MLRLLCLSCSSFSAYANRHLPWKCQFNHLPLLLLYVGHSVIWRKKFGCCDQSVVCDFSCGVFQCVSFLPMSTYQQFQKFSLRLMLSSSCLLSPWGQEVLPSPYLRTVLGACQTLVHSQPVFASTPHPLTFSPSHCCC